MKITKKMMMMLPILLAMQVPATAGLSLVLTPSSVTFGVNDPNLPKEQAWRVEFQMHDWVLPTFDTNGASVWDFNGVGASAVLLMQGSLRVINKRDGGLCDLSLAGRTNVLVRIQRDPANLRFSCEIWNYDGTGYGQLSSPIGVLGTWPYSGGALGSPLTTTRLGFLRFWNTLVPDGSRPPTSATVGSLLNLTFDGNTQDSSGKGHNVTFPGATFVTTPNQVPVALPKTDGAPAWSNWVSLRAGFPATLDGTNSFSLSDGNDAVNYRWQQVAGPSTVRWSDRSAAKPVIRGLIFGTYKFRLQVTDAASKSTSTDLEVGAVAMDSKGVVINANPAADVLFGPMIGFGRNPWPWADEMTLRAATIRKNFFDAISPPGWGASLQGTVSYQPGIPGQPAETGLTVAVQPADMSLTVSNASKLDLATLPTIVQIFPLNAWVPVEEVRICSVSGNTLNVCYDGRAVRSGLWQRVNGPQAWPVGAAVRQEKTLGTGTTFLRDFCPAGPGEEGQVVYSAGSIQVTAGKANVAGNSTAWATSLVGSRIRIEGTHGGQPFVFFAGIANIASGTGMTLSRPWPADADTAAGLTYAIIQPGRSIVRGWLRPDGTNGKQKSDVSLCESDTTIYQSEFFSSMPGGYQSGQFVGYVYDTWFSDTGPNYYDEVLAHYAGYLRSGLNLFRDNARKIGYYWTTAPNFDEAWISVIPRRVGATGLAAAALIDGRTNNWYTLRRLAGAAIVDPFSGAILSDCDQDLRETAYGLSWLAIAALFDPVDTGNPNEPNQRSYWKAQLARAYARDAGCKGPNASFPNNFYNGGYGVYSLTQGSRTVTGSNISPSLCNWAGSGTINVTNGSTGATGTGFSPNAKIVISAQRLGKPYLFQSEFTVSSSSSITLASPFDGDSGSYAYQIESDAWWLAFSTSVKDHTNTDTLYACKWIDASTVMLDRPWAAATGTYAATRNNLVGYGQEPFLLGIKVFAMKLAAQTDSGQTAANYAALAADSATWILTHGYDPLTGGLHYARDLSGCEPKLNPRLNCTFGLSASEKQQSRLLNAEAQNSLRVAYEANPTQEVRDFGDQFYGAQWGKKGGPYFDDVYLNSLDADTVWRYKWLGFLFGIGMAHQWPAARLGGVQPPSPAVSSIAFNLSSVSGAASARITVTQPSGAESVFACNASPCPVRVDTRQGAHWYRISYLDSRGAVLQSAEPDLLEVN